MPERHDWQHWRSTYVCSDVTLQEISVMPNAPSIAALKRRSASEDWQMQRRQFVSLRDTKVVNDQGAEAAIARVQSLLDASEALAKHLKIAKSLQRISIDRLRDMKSDELSPALLVQWLKFACDLERSCLNLASEHVKIDVSLLSDEELQALAGEAL